MYEFLNVLFLGSTAMVATAAIAHTCATTITIYVVDSIPQLNPGQHLGMVQHVYIQAKLFGSEFEQQHLFSDLRPDESASTYLLRQTEPRYK